MKSYLRIKSPWSQLALFFGLFGAGFFLSSIFAFVVLYLNHIPISDFGKLDWSKPEVLKAMKWLQGVSSITMFLLPALLFALITFTRRPLYFLGIRKATKNFNYWLAIVCIFCAFPFVFWLGELNQLVPLPVWMTELEKDAARQMESFLKVNRASDIMINVFIIAMLPAFCEELCFRGALQRILIHLTKSPWLGILIASILFSALHFQFQGFLPRMFLGMVLGALYWYSGSLWPCIIAHFVNNATQVIAVSYAPRYVNENPGLPVYAGVISGILVFLIIRHYHRHSTSTYYREYESEELNKYNEFIA
ncbi:MAG TPA: CPBP family intramembrane glutamic endopeptidase [Flavitalea sp.]|nr:CPBP family intramembrane glutamic endopeptidase [Flavitalea sp.]